MTGGFLLVSYPSTVVKPFILIPRVELQMRRPNKEKYRLDKLLERKAREGVKIYVIL